MVKYIDTIRLKAFFLTWVLRLLHRTWRVRINNRENMDRLYTEQKRFLLCFWHGKYIPIFPILEGYKACVISSQSARGSVIARICRQFGYKSTQLANQPERNSLKNLSRILSGISVGATAVDGPLGPNHLVKGGIIRIVSSFGFALLPISFQSNWKLVLNKRWDHLEIPLPFAKVNLIIGEAINLPKNIRPVQTRAWADNLAQELVKLDKKE